MGYFQQNAISDRVEVLYIDQIHYFLIITHQKHF